MEFETDLLNKSANYVQSFLNRNLSDKIYYHDIDHTKEVVDAAYEIGRATGLSDKELETVMLAAWFHDTGYYEGSQNHEVKSKEIAEEFLRKEGVPEMRIADVAGCIIATKIPQRPTNKMEEVLCDADLYHLSTEEFFNKSELLRKEFSQSGSSEIKDKAWLKKSIKFLKKHNFFTEYARNELLPDKKENLKKLKSIKEELKLSKKKDMEDSRGQEADSSTSGKKKKKSKKESKKPGRGIETLFRITSRNHVDFSSMADNKANIMISVNSIMLSILFSILFRHFDEYPYLIYPTVILTIVCTSTIIFAILATRPNLTAGVFTKQDIIKRKTNLLFFGNFHKMPLSDYEWGVRRLMDDRDYLYGSIIRDIYFLGKVLGRKYFFLRISYNIFMFGLVISLIAFVIWGFLIPEGSI